MKKFFKWLWGDDHKYLSGFVTLCLVLELLPVQSIAYGLDEMTAQANEQSVEQVVETEGAPEEVSEPEVVAPEAPAEEPVVVPEEPAAEEPPAVVEEPTAEATQEEATPEEGQAADESDEQEQQPAEAEEETAVDDADAKKDEAEEKKQDEEVKMPADTLSMRIGGTTVVASFPEGTFPQDTEMVVKSVPATDELLDKVNRSTDVEIAAVQAFDITFWYKGEEIQPKKPVTVTFENTAIDTEGAPVFHMSDSGAIEAVTSVNEASEDEVTFQAQEFSTYITTQLKAADDEGDAAKAETETWTIRFYNWDANVTATVEVEKGQPIGDALPAVPNRDDYTGKWYVGTVNGYGNFTYEGEALDGNFTPNADTIVVPKYDLINYTVTFYTDETKTGVVDTRTVNADTNYGVNNPPAVPDKAGYSGRWVYSGGDYSNAVKATSDLDVWAAYTQNTFTVKFMNDAEVYQTDTYYAGNTLVLADGPVVEGKTFEG